jgi:hypothetical protein
MPSRAAELLLGRKCCRRRASPEASAPCSLTRPRRVSDIARKMCFVFSQFLLAAQKAIREFNEAQFDGRVITVKLDRKAV